MALDTQRAAEVMALCAREMKRPDWIRLGQVISRTVDRMPEATAEEIAEQVVRAYRGTIVVVE